MHTSFTRTFGLLASALLLILLAGCASLVDARQLAWLETADPKRDVGEAIARGDLRFYAVNGFAAGMVPGVSPSGADSALVRAHGMRTIRGTSDHRGNHRLNQLAAEYASTYNRLLLRHLRSLPSRNSAGL